jgi:hypothetical protein
MKKNKIENSGVSFDNYLVFNISSVAEDYHLAYLLNNQLDIHLSKTPDLQVVEDTKNQVFYSCFYYQPDCRLEYYLLKDTSLKGALISNYFLIVKGFLDPVQKDFLMDEIGKTEKILQVEDLKLMQSSKSNKSAKIETFLKHLFTDLEFHTLEIKKLQNESKVTLRMEKPLRPKKLY